MGPPEGKPMKIIRFAERNWRPDAQTLISTGDYRIPLDMSEELAQRALAEGAAVLVAPAALERKPAPARLETKPAPRGATSTKVTPAA